MTSSATEPQYRLWLRFRRWLASIFDPDDDSSSYDTPPGSAHPHGSPYGDTPPSPVAPPSVSSDYVEAVELANVAVDEKLRADFHHNLREPVRLRSLQFASVAFFADTAWEFRPSVNVLLGRNGYGKSLLLRALAGMLQRREDVLGDLLDGVDPDGRIELRVTRNGLEEKVERRHVWRDSLGKVPLLAIPDSRFTDRRHTTVLSPDTLDLASDGALHLLDQLPYQSIVEGLLYGLCLDYQEHGRSFDRPNFALLRDVVRRLTDETFEFHSIDRVGRTGFEIWVLTEGLDRPLRIQQASQGTASVLTIFGLIHTFLDDIAEAANPDGYDPDEVLNQEAIVIIDEVDAHLHPVWQQKIRNLLAHFFPNVQFVLSAHSPLVVAGCGPGEVAVLRRSSEGFVVEQLPQDFVGATAQDLYHDIFDIEDLDEVFLKYATQEASGQGEELDKRIAKLQAKDEKGKLSPAEVLELDRLLLELRRIRRVSEIQRERHDRDELVLQREAEIKRLNAEIARLENRPTSARDTAATPEAAS